MKLGITVRRLWVGSGSWAGVRWNMLQSVSKYISLILLRHQACVVSSYPGDASIKLFQVCTAPHAPAPHRAPRYRCTLQSRESAPPMKTCRVMFGGGRWRAGQLGTHSHTPCIICICNYHRTIFFFTLLPVDR